MNTFKTWKRPHRVAVMVAALLVLSVSVSLGEEKTFKDVTEAVGLSGMQDYFAAAWGDYNNDGWPDLYVCGRLYRNEGGARFTEATGKADAPGVLPNLGRESGLWGDYDNDGYEDLFIYTAWKLYRNVNGTTFVDASTGLPERPEIITRGAAWTDLDGDSYLDIYVGSYEGGAVQTNVVLHNKGGGSFEPWWQTPSHPTRGVTAADFDEDGDQDVYISNYRLVANGLGLNDGSGSLSDVGVEYGVAGTYQLGCYGHTIGSAWGDLDNDGHLDLFVGNFSHPAAYQDRPKFLRNLGPEGEFHFADKSDGAGLAWQESFATPALGDYDNDGDLDLYFTAVYAGDTGVLYSNNGNWTFANVTSESGLANLQQTYGAAWADYDNDGDLDLMTNGKLFNNSGNANHWLKVRLQGGGKVNRSAIGAQVRLFLGEQMITRQVEAGTGEGNQNEMTLHFGLGAHDAEVELEIRWPDGIRQKLTATPDRLLTVHHGGIETE